MPQVMYGGVNGKAMELEPSKDMLAVRTHSGRSMRGVVVARPEASALNEMEFVCEFPEAGVEIFRSSARNSTARKAMETTKSRLMESPDTRFAGHVLMEPQTGEPVIYTENLFVKFADDCTDAHCEEMLAEMGLVVKRALTYARNAWFVAVPEGTGQRVFDIALSMLERDDVELCHPELIREKQSRSIFAQQWHLKTTSLNGVTVNASANVEAALELTQGEGITIAVIDDGVDIDHEEFRSAGKIVAPRDMRFSENDPRHTDPRPGTRDNHGTACAGVACGDGKFGASGVAPRARLMPIRSMSALGSQAEADAFKWAADHGADVISCSWGPPDGQWFNPNDPVHNRVVPLPDSTRLAIEYAIQNGRGGRGCVICWAAGNGNESVDNDGYASDPHVYAIAACNDRSRRSVYSDFGNAVFCSFPSSDFGYAPLGQPEPLTPGIWTTDRSGRAGYNNGDTRLGDLAGNYTNSFGGTSSACPGAAGVAALVLSANPDLRWDEVGSVLRRSCDRIDPQAGGYTDGRSRLYGFGRLNAENAVRLAQPSPVAETITVASNFGAAILDFQTAEVSLPVGEMRELSAIRVIVDIQHTYIGDLIVTLIPPSASGVGEIVLHNRAGRSTRNINRTFAADAIPRLRDFAGTKPTGTWKLRVEDRARRDEGVIRRFGLELVPVPSRTPAAARATAARSRAAKPASKTAGKRRSRRKAKA